MTLCSRELLQGIIAQHMRTPFVWGEHDCFLFPSFCVDQLYGYELMPGIKGTYKTAKGALRIIKRHVSTTSLIDFANLCVGERIQTDIMPSVCDLVAIQTNDAFACALGIYDGSRGWFTSEHGLTPRTEFLGTWKLCPQ